MLTVWKFPLELDDIVDVRMPSGAKLLHVDSQDPGVLQLWALVDDKPPFVTRRFRIAGTGHNLAAAGGLPTTDGGRWPPLDLTTLVHVGTVLDRMFVWHVFDLGEVPS